MIISKAIQLIASHCFLYRKSFAHFLSSKSTISKYNQYVQIAVVSYRQDIKVAYAQNTHLHLTLQCQYLP